VILAISGSLRRDSLNSAALRAAAHAAARTGLAVELDDSPRRLPHFNPDLESQLPEAVQRFRAISEHADAILLAVPEYAFGIPGALKNALDWTVGSGAVYRKPIAVLSVAPAGRGAHVRRALQLVLTALDCDASWHHVPIHPSLLDQGQIRDEPIIRELVRVVETLAARIPQAQTALTPCSAPERNL
jgi:chromate reductase, NAD(P)H dehydrogenase (quinone)